MKIKTYQYSGSKLFLEPMNFAIKRKILAQISVKLNLSKIKMHGNMNIPNGPSMASCTQDSSMSAITFSTKIDQYID